MRRFIPASIAAGSPSLKRALLITAMIAVWGFFLWRAVHTFAPDSNYVFFNSDCAIPILMANDDRPITVSNTYYYGQDRWGGWPMLLAQLVRRTLNYRWTDQSFFVMQAVCAFAGALVLASLARRRDRFPVMIAYLITLCLHGEARHHLFELSEVYAWQVTPLLLGWYCLRRTFETRRGNAKGELWRLYLWCFLALWFSFLAILSSFASAPFIFFLLTLESLRAHLKAEEEEEKNGARRRRIWLKSYARGFAIVLVAMLAEVLLRINYRRYSMRRYGYDFKTETALDTGHLTGNLFIQLQRVFEFRWWPLFLLSLLAALSLLCALVYLRVKRSDDLLQKLRAKLSDRLPVLILGTCGIALINFVLIVLVNHVRFNQYDRRYLTLTYLFGSVSGLLTLLLSFDYACGYFSLRRYARTAPVIAGVLFLALWFPAASWSPYYELTKETALVLARKAPGAVLMGGYWETFVFAALQPENTMTPVPYEGQQVRMPWTKETVRQADRIILEYRHSKFGGSGVPPQHTVQYGASFQLVDPLWYEDGENAFALYRNESR
ncbi:MAG TPA: hypothetical protein VGX92_13565 [Pyrinomonadaceae bacterium]|jgi:hypothetical protein|nr:hypothetical protein [Pyrinomonadaceae bacterium]